MENLSSNHQNFIYKFFSITLLLLVLTILILAAAFYSTNKWRDLSLLQPNHETVASESQAVIYVLLTILFLIFVITAYAITQFIKSKANALQMSLEVEKIEKDISSFNNHFSKSSSLIANNSNQIAGQLHQASDVLTQIVDQSTKDTESIKAAIQHTADGSKIVLSGSQDMKDLVLVIEKIHGESMKISDVSKVIENIAYQTNLLALNAAVEAAHAGEKGKGFAVVAEAVQTLAQKAAAATKEINALIKESVNSAENSAQVVDKASGVFHKISASIDQAHRSLQKISVDTNLQTQRFTDVSATVGSAQDLVQKMLQDPKI